MAQDTERLLISLEIDTDKAQKDAADAMLAIEKLKDANKELRKANAELAKAEGDNTAAIKANTEQIALNEAGIRNSSNELRNNQKVLQASQNTTEGVTGAYQRLQQQYSAAAQRAKDLAAEYGSLDERTISAANTANNLSNRLKEIDSSVGQNQRNVGNYSSVLALLPSGFGDVAKGVQGAKLGFEALGKTPLLVILTTLIQIIMKLAGQFGKNEEQAAKLKALFAPLSIAADKFTRVIEGLVDIFIKSVEWAGKAWSALSEFLGLAGDAQETEADRYIKLEQDKQKAVEKTREVNERNAGRELEISKLRSSCRKRQIYSRRKACI